jgi:DNA polymerase elongation subunit (family B)
MIENRIINNCLFFDVETATGCRSFGSLSEDNPRMASLWSKRCDYYRRSDEKLSKLSDAEIYLEKASLEPEFSRIVCISFGLIEDNGSSRFISFYGSDEVDILEKSSKVFNNASAKGMKLCGHNIKGFDVPCISKRMLFNGIKDLPRSLVIWDKKPWDLPFLDTSEIFAFGSWVQQKYLSLDLLSCALDIDSPKDDIDGSMVSGLFWGGEDNQESLERIKEYCERDVDTVIKTLQKISS